MLLAEFEDTMKKGFDARDVSQSLGYVPAEKRNTDEFRFEHFAWNVCFNPFNNSGSAFVFIYDSLDKNGERATFPDFHVISEQALCYWEQRRVSAKNPLIQLRYSELIREYKSQFPSVKIDKNFYTQSIEVIIRIIQENYCSDPCEALMLLKWLCRLTHTNQQVFPTVKRLMHDYMCAKDSLDERKDLFGDYLEIVVNYFDKFDAEEVSRITFSGEDYFNHLIDLNEYWPLHEFVPHLMSFYKLVGCDVKVKKSLDFLINLLHNQKEPAMRMQYMYYDLQKLAQKYKLDKENSILISRMQYWAKQAHNNRAKITSSISIKKEKIDQFVDSIIPHKKELQLHAFINHFIPSVSKIRASIPQNDLLSLMTLSYTDEEGHPMAMGDNNPNRKLMREMSTYLKWNAIFMAFCVEKMEQSGAWTQEAIIEHIKKCPIPIPKKYLSDLNIILKHFFHGEYCEFCYMLIPQFECFIRHLLESENVTTITRREHTNGYQLKQLDTLLREQVMRLIYDEYDDSPITLYLRCLLTDMDGLNYRNRLSHGQMRPSEFNDKHIALLLLHAFLLLLTLEKKD